MRTNDTDALQASASPLLAFVAQQRLIVPIYGHIDIKHANIPAGTRCCDTNFAMLFQPYDVRIALSQHRMPSEIGARLS